MTTIHCNCGNEIEADVLEIYDSASSPGLIEEILSGNFLSFPCSSCGAVIKPEIPARIVDKKHGMDIIFRPENERIQFLSGKLELPRAERVVFGYPELVEKVTIFTNDLDDKVIEIIKYLYVKKGGPGSDLSIFLDSIERKNLKFRIHGLKDNEIGIANIGFDFYKKIEKELNDIMTKEDLHEVLSPPHISIQKVYLGEDQ